MVSINYATREITCKIVYYGPGLSGKTTNLLYVHKKVPTNTKGKMISLATEADRTLYFDFLPINIGTINGFAAKFQLYTVPGQVYYNATRKLVLRGVDGLVFVADSQSEKMDENIESLTNLRENLAEYGYDIDDIPVVMQYNKRDLPGALSVEDLNARLNPDGWANFEGEAVSGRGVFDTLKMIIKLVLEKAKSSSSKKEKKPATAQAASPVREAVPEPQPEPAGAGQGSYSPGKPEGEPGTGPVPAETTPPEYQREAAYNADDIPREQGIVDTREDRGMSDAVPGEAKQPGVGGPAVPEPVERQQRPFPGSSSSRIARRDRRITVSDFQPASRSEESDVAEEKIPVEEVESPQQESGLPSPAMAPSQRLVRKKRGFFKRLFGIK
jgi:signal recognition particle receptor subunit beta